MKKKIATILICMLVAICSVFTVVTSTSVNKQILVIQSNSSKQGGTLLITEFNGNRVIEVDSGGTIVWEKAGLDFPIDVERISKPPDAPTISGPNTGKPNTDYDFTFNSVDPDGDDVRFIINWGDGNNETTSFTASGTNLTVSHSWSEKGTYSIIARAEDGYDALSDWSGPYQIIIKKSKSINSPFHWLQNWLQSHPNLFPIIRQLLGL